MADPTPEAEAQQARRKAKAKEREEEAKRLELEAVKRLRKILKEDRNLAICVGSGVTLFSTSDDKGKGRTRLTWKGLIQNGFDYLQSTKPKFYRDNKERCEKATNKLDNADDTDDVLEAASTLMVLMNAHGNSFTDANGTFATWLSKQFETLSEYVKCPAILESLKKLHGAGATLMTTNYDGLIESHCDLQPLDGSQPQQLVRFGRRELSDVVFHPHGYWKNTKHIVLDSRQYYEVGHKGNDVRQTLEAMLKGWTVVFVGCGGGVSDPNFGPLLRWLGQQQKDVSYGHYILLMKGEDYPELEALPLNKVHVARFDDIAPWLEDLLSDSTPAPPPPTLDSPAQKALLDMLLQMGLTEMLDNLLGAGFTEEQVGEIMDFIKSWIAKNLPTSSRRNPSPPPSAFISPPIPFRRMAPPPPPSSPYIPSSPPRPPPIHRGGIFPPPPPPSTVISPPVQPSAPQ